MARKGKQIVWHKKRGKMISSKFLNHPSKKADSQDSAPGTGDKTKDFARNLAAQIKKAANG